jgi:superfamily II DNA or RNA helicase
MNKIQKNGHLYRFIANDERTSNVLFELNKSLSAIQPNHARIATAYLTPDGFRALKSNLGQAGKVQLLLGERPFLFRRGPTDTLEPGESDDLLGPLEAIRWDEFLEGSIPWILMNHEERKLLIESDAPEALELRKTFPLEIWEKVKDLVNFLRREDVEIRRYLGELAGSIPESEVLDGGRLSKVRLHAKAYIFRGDEQAYALIGSSNLTKGGLEGNIEANLATTDSDDVRQIEGWFDRKWDEGQDCKDQYVRLLEESVLFGARFTPWQVFLKALYVAYGRFLGLELSEEVAGRLAQFQGEGVSRAVDLMEKHWGAMICDSVGLGKTYSGLGILTEYLARRETFGKALVICPAQLENNWSPDKLRAWGIPAETITMESLAKLAELDEIENQIERRKKERLLRELQTYDIVLVDESHNFRNPGTKRYQALMEIIRGGTKPDKRVVLMTATPVNNSLWDLYHQLMLITRGDNSWYVGRGPVDNLEGLFRQLEKSGGGMGLLDTMLLTMVRRTRHDIRKRQEAGEPVEIGGKPLEFPKHNIPEALTYSLETVYAGIYQRVVSVVEDLNFAIYNLEEFGIEDPKKEEASDNLEAEVKRNRSFIGILKTTYLKRMESSVIALEASLKSQAAYLDLFLKFLEDGYVLRPKDRDRLKVSLGQSLTDDLVESLEIEELDTFADKLQRVSSGEFDHEAIRTSVLEDRDAIKDLVDDLGTLEVHANPGTDPKITELRNLINSFPMVDVHNIPTKIVIFTNYKDTAEHIFRCFGGPDRGDRRGEFRWRSDLEGEPWLSILTGSDDKKRRSEVLNRFAPLSFLREDEELDDPLLLERIEPYRNEGIEIIIATDVLSEGQNLQDAQYLINFDLHWNPVRMIQRGGRIDRLFSPHKEVFFYNIMPEQGLEELLNLVSRLKKRVGAIDATLGLDASVLGEVIEEKALDDIIRIKQGGTSADQIYLEGEKKQDLDDALDEIQFYIDLVKQMGTEEAQTIPDGIYSIREGEEPGVFIMLKMPEEHGGQVFWRFYPFKDTQTITSAIEVAKRIVTDPDALRAALPDDSNPFTFLIDPLQKAIGEIGAEYKRSRSKHDPGELVRLVRTKCNNDDIEEAATELVDELLLWCKKHHPADLLKREDAIQESYRTLKSAVAVDEVASALKGLWESLQAKGLDRGLPRPSQTEPTEKDLQLICWELVIPEGGWDEESTPQIEQQVEADLVEA